MNVSKRCGGGGGQIKGLSEERDGEEQQQSLVKGKADKNKIYSPVVENVNLVDLTTKLRLEHDSMARIRADEAAHDHL